MKQRPAIEHRWLPWLLALAAAAVAALLQAVPALQRADQRLHDSVLAQSLPEPAPQGITLVEIDEQSLALLGPWPWPRPVLAQMAQRLREHGARLQVWDVMLSHATPGDEALHASLQQPDVVFAQVPVIDAKVLTPPAEGALRGQPLEAGLPCSAHPPVTGHLGVTESLPELKAGHTAAPRDVDGRLRRVPAVICHQQQALPQLAMAAAQADEPLATWTTQPAAWGAAGHTLKRGRWSFVVDEQGWLTVPFQRGHADWPAIRAEQLLNPGAQLPPLQGQLVLVGGTALGMGDAVGTAREPWAPGMSVHAELLDAGLHPAAWPWRPAAPALAAALLALLCAGALATRAQAGGRRLVAWGALAVAAPLVLAALARSQGALLPATAPALAIGALVLCTWALQVARLRLEGQRLRRNLESFMPAALARRVTEQHSTGESLGEPVDGTVMALRITGLERWMARVDPLRAMGLLHAVHAAVQARAAAQGGRVDYAQGHTLLVVWPQAQAPQVRTAVAVAQACWNELLPVLRNNEDPDHPLGLESAVECGAFWAGVVGTVESRRLVVLGHTVADALAMLELASELAAPLLLGPVAGQRLAEAGPASFATAATAAAAPADPSASAQAALAASIAARLLGRFVLPGQAVPKALHQVLLPVPAA